MIKAIQHKEEEVEMLKPKRISVSRKRQITIPKEYFDELQIKDMVDCKIVNGSLVIRPVSEELDFSQYILEDLIHEGYEGEKLLHEFSYRKSQIRPALNQMVAENRDNITYSRTEDFFDKLDEEEGD